MRPKTTNYKHTDLIALIGRMQLKVAENSLCLYRAVSGQDLPSGFGLIYRLGLKFISGIDTLYCRLRNSNFQEIERNMIVCLIKYSYRCKPIWALILFSISVSGFDNPGTERLPVKVEAMRAMELANHYFMIKRKRG